MYCIIGMLFALVGCTNRDTIVNKKNLSGFDFRLFQGTQALGLAKATETEDVNGIKEDVGKNKKLLSFRESRFGYNLLEMAVKTEKYKSVEALVDLGADPNLQDTYSGSSALMEAAKVGSLFGIGNGTDSRYLKLLLKHGGNPNAEEKGVRQKGNHTRNTPLLIACSHGELEYVRILVEAGANVNYTNEFGQTTLYSATISNNPNIVIYLLEHNADFRHPLYSDFRDKKKNLVYQVIPLAQTFSKKYPNVTVIGANGDVIFQNGKVVDIHGLRGEKGGGHWNIYRNGKLIKTEKFTIGKPPGVSN